MRGRTNYPNRNNRQQDIRPDYHTPKRTLDNNDRDDRNTPLKKARYDRYPDRNSQNIYQDAPYVFRSEHYNHNDSQINNTNLVANDVPPNTNNYFPKSNWDCRGQEKYSECYEPRSNFRRYEDEYIFERKPENKFKRKSKYNSRRFEPDYNSRHFEPDYNSRHFEPDYNSRHFEQDYNSRHFEQDQNSRRFEQDQNSRRFEQDQNSRRFEQDYDSRHFEPDHNSRRFEPDYDSRHFEPDYDSRHFEPNYDSRHFEPNYDSRHFEPNYDSRHFEPNYDSRHFEPNYDSRHFEPNYDSRHIEPDYDSRHLESVYQYESNTVYMVRHTTEFRGYFQNSYYHFTDYITKRERNNDFRSLGAVVENKNEYYFAESQRVKLLAENFLSGFWSIKNNEIATKNYHHLKFADKNKGNQEFQNDPMHATCISFVDITIEDNEYCLIAISGIKKISNELSEQLIKYVEEINSCKNNKPYILLVGRINNFNTILSLLKNDNDMVSFKECSEKYYAHFLTKLFLEYGNNLQINGVANCRFYPYRPNYSYGNQENSIDKTVCHISNDSRIVSSGFNVVYISCCRTCSMQKNEVLSIMKSAQDLGNNYIYERRVSPNQNRQQTFMSPARNNLVRNSNSSVLNGLSLFSHNDYTGNEIHESENQLRVENFHI